VGVLQILDAERAVQRARIGAAGAQAQRLQDSAELIVALGGDSPLAPATTASTP
jgi:outer membrane protein TolC